VVSRGETEVIRRGEAISNVAREVISRFASTGHGDDHLLH